MNTEISKGTTIALAGNPNVGKSTVFNSLTGLKQHTGNWTGKTVENAGGKCRYKGQEYIIYDLPGTYSIMSGSAEEEVAREFICFGGADAIVVVADATCLERNLNLLFQITEITDNVVLCVNLIDQAEKKKIKIDFAVLENLLGIPVVPISAVQKNMAFDIFPAIKRILEKNNDKTDGHTKDKFYVNYGEEIESAIDALSAPLLKITKGRLSVRFAAIKLLEGEQKIINSIETFLSVKFCENPEIQEALAKAIITLKNAGIDNNNFSEKIVGRILSACEETIHKTVNFKNPDYNARDRKIDKILTSKLFGIPIMLLLLGAVFFITIVLSNYPSRWLASLFGFIEKYLNKFFSSINTPWYIQKPLMDGIYKTTAWVIAVMLPPMAIFFPLFTILEDLGYLPRVAFNLDKPFKKCGCCGKQCLTMCMGFGCNAAAIVNTRIIDSPRERLIAILTNNFVPCNGRFPTLIAVSGFFIGGLFASPVLGGIVSAFAVIFLILCGIFMTFIVSGILSKTLLKGVPSSFSLELPPFRKPQFKKILIRSFLDRTIFVLWRAVKVAAPCGLLIWFLGNINAGGLPLIQHMAVFINPFARLMGMDGYILTSFILGFPANEIVLPIALMSYTYSGTLVDFESIGQLGALLSANGWSLLTGINVLIFTLFHFPCATSVLSIVKETKSTKWTLLSVLIPTLTGIIICMAVTGVWRLIALLI